MNKVIIGVTSVAIVSFVLIKNMNFRRKKELKESLQKIVELCKEEYYYDDCELVNYIESITPSSSPVPEMETLLSSKCSTPISFTMVNERIFH
jgi:hypothetical protein